MSALPGQDEEGADTLLSRLRCGKAPALIKADTGSSSLPQNKMCRVKHLNDMYSKVKAFIIIE